jgi:hypothetical protein
LMHRWPTRDPLQHMWPAQCHAAISHGCHSMPFEVPWGIQRHPNASWCW